MKYPELSDKEIGARSPEQKIEEINKAFDWLSDNYKPPNNKGEYTAEDNRHKHELYVYFNDIVQRLVGWEHR